MNSELTEAVLSIAVAMNRIADALDSISEDTRITRQIAQGFSRCLSEGADRKAFLRVGDIGR